jgi:HlyD family secretion protein
MNYKKLILPILLLAVGVVGFAALKATRPEQSPVKPQERIWKVDTLAAKLASLSPSLTLTGQVESPAQTSAAAPGLGRVVRVLAREGQAVSMGQALVELDNRDFAPRVDQARGQVQELDAAIRSEELRHASDLDQLAQERKLLDFAAADVARFEQLQKENFYSQAAVDQSRSSLAQRQITLRTRELAVADHQARLAQLNARLSSGEDRAWSRPNLALARSRVVAPVQRLHRQGPGRGRRSGEHRPGAAQPLSRPTGWRYAPRFPHPNQDEILSRLGKGGTPQGQPPRSAARPSAFSLNRVAGAADARGLDGFFRLDRQQHAGLRVGSLVTLHLERAAAVERHRHPLRRAVWRQRRLQAGARPAQTDRRAMCSASGRATRRACWCTARPSRTATACWRRTCPTPPPACASSRCR